MVSTFLMQVIVVGMSAPVYDLGRIAEIVNDKMTISYFRDATMWSAQPSVQPFLESYHRLSSELTFHSQEKPPGPILYYVLFLRMLSKPGDAALLGGLVIGLLSTLSVPATYLLAKLFTRDTTAALFAAACFQRLSRVGALLPHVRSDLPGACLRHDGLLGAGDT